MSSSAVRTTPRSRVREELERTRLAQAVVGGGLEGPPTNITAGLLAGVLGRVYAELVAARWPRLRDVLEQDVMYHARMLAERGVEAVLAELAPDARLDHDAVGIDRPPRSEPGGRAAGSS